MPEPRSVLVIVTQQIGDVLLTWENEAFLALQPEARFSWPALMRGASVGGAALLEPAQPGLIDRLVGDPARRVAALAVRTIGAKK